MDCRDPIARADARLPILLASGIFLLGPVTVESVLVPKAEVNEFPLPDSQWEPKGLRELRRKAELGEIILAPKEEPDDWHQRCRVCLQGLPPSGTALTWHCFITTARQMILLITAIT